MLPLRCCYNPTTTMKTRLHLFYADSDAAATLLPPRWWSYAFVALLYPFYIKSDVQLIIFSWTSTIDALKSLCLSYKPQTYYVGWSMRPRHDGGGGQKVLGSSLTIRRQTATIWALWLTNKSNEDRSLFTRELNRSGLILESKSATPTLEDYCNQAWSWPERQERSGSVAEAPMLTMPK